MKRLFLPLFLILALFAQLANAINPYELRVNQRDPTNSFFNARDMSIPSGENGIFIYDNATQLPKFFTLGTGLRWNGSVLEAAPTAFNFGDPAAKSITIGSAFQCADNTKACVISVTLGSTASLTQSGGSANAADCVIGATSGIDTSGGTTWAQYRNAVSGAVGVDVTVSPESYQTFEFKMPAGAYGAVRQTSGSVSVISASEQTVN